MSDWVIGIGVVVVPGVVVFVVHTIGERRRLRVFYERGDLRGEWRERFPESSEEEVGELLRMFVDAFLLRRGSEFAFGPGDRVMDVYRAIYPRPGMAGAMEGEVFVISVRRRYGVDIEPLWREDVTLGEVFGWVRGNALVAK